MKGNGTFGQTDFGPGKYLTGILCELTSVLPKWGMIMLYIKCLHVVYSTFYVSVLLAVNVPKKIVSWSVQTCNQVLFVFWVGNF